MAKADLDKRKKVSRRKKKAGQRKWQDRVWENVKIALVALSYAAVYLSANALAGCTIVRRVINENIFWVLIILPVVLLLLRSWLSGAREWDSLFLNAVIGLFTGLGLYYFLITAWLGPNYLIPSTAPYERKAVVYGMRMERPYRQAFHNYLTLRFTDNGEWYTYDADYKVYEAVQPGDTCILTIRDGLWGYPVINNLQPPVKIPMPRGDIKSLLELLKEEGKTNDRGKLRGRPNPFAGHEE